MAALTLLYDRDCAFCTWTALQLRSLDRRRRIALVPLQEARRGGVRPDLAAVAAGYPLVERIHAVTNGGEVVAGGRAMLAALEALPGGHLLGPWFRLAEATGLAEIGYDVLAAQRDRLARLVGAREPHDPACPTPPVDPAPLRAGDGRRSTHRHDAASRPGGRGHGLRAAGRDTHPTTSEGGSSA
ncbi:MAG TPA: DUF393 domain-containing protein [Candidatus Limnocylindrales bacterium]|jgi:predicted DCC family thiol-disulfide oxidoreductase YuxK|nr:DUF393 domain-containing protein [Candidatus Limnocylindrales bacterium]